MRYLFLLVAIALMAVSFTPPPPLSFERIIDVKYKLPKIQIKDSALLFVIDSIILTDTCPVLFNPKYNVFLDIRRSSDSLYKFGFTLRDYPIGTDDKVGFFYRKGVNFIFDISLNDSVYQKTKEYKTFHYKGPYLGQDELTSWYFIKKGKAYILESKYCIPFHD